MFDPYDLQRFVDAQDGVYDQALAELRAGRKRSHWMWFIFPQIAGLGVSPTSQHFAIKSLAEARAYLAHPILGPRLIECAETILALQQRSAADVFGHPDDLKLRSSATLFAEASEPKSPFEQIVKKYFAGERDAQTMRLIARRATGAQE